MTSRHFQNGTVGGPEWEAYDHEGTDGKYILVDNDYVLNWNNYSKSHWIDHKTPVSSGVYAGTFPTPSGHVPSSSYGYDDYMGVSLDSKLLDKTKKHSFNLAVAAAEGKETVTMIVDTIKTCGLAARDLKRGNIISAATRFGASTSLAHSKHKVSKTNFTSKDLMSKWLELQYGWLPLFNDVYEAMKAFHALTAKPRKSTVRVGNKQVRQNYSFGSSSPSLYDIRGELRSKKRIMYEMSEVLPVQRQLGLTDPLSVAWELIPYSFVLDWFIPIGTYLSNLNQIPQLRGRFLTTTVCEYKFRSVLLPPSLPAWQGASVNGTSLRIDRTASTGLSAVTPSFKSIPDAMSELHIANALALARQHFH